MFKQNGFPLSQGFDNIGGIRFEVAFFVIAAKVGIHVKCWLGRCSTRENDNPSWIFK
jgi:hypothetical protein